MSASISEQAQLSEEELAALRDSDPSDRGPQSITVSELFGQDKSVRQNANRREKRLAEFAQLAADVTARNLGLGGVEHSAESEVLGVGGVREALDSLCAGGRFRQDQRPIGAVGVDPELAFTLVEHAFGAMLEGEDAPAPTPLARRTLTPVESAVVTPYLTEISQSLIQALPGVKEADGKPSFEATTLSTFELPSDIESALLWRVQMSFAGRSGTVQAVIFPSWLSLELATQLNEDADLRRHLHRHIEALEVNVVAELGTKHMSLDALANLAPGDVLRLDSHQSDTLPLKAAGATIFLGKPVHRNGVLAFEIVSEVT